MDTTETRDDSNVLYSVLFLNSTSLAAKLVAPYHKISHKQCFILSMFNPVKPHFKQISCSQPYLKYFICEEPRLINNTSVVNINYQSNKDYLKQCNSGQYVSTLFLCDGYNDCFDQTDELECYCFVNGSRIDNNTFCYEHCSYQINCRCPILFTNEGSNGCSSFFYQKSNQSINLVPSSDVFHCDTFLLNIPTSLIDDLVFDCPNGNDEKELLEMQSTYLYRCPHPDMIECYPGHSRCYTREQKCTYILDKETETLLYCRNGQHLQNCNHIQCIWKFKCQNSYCIPYQYICDGKWDCWYGQDELQCDQYTCIGMFKCRYSVSCLHIRNTCDGVADCPMEDDEQVCPKINCIDECKCLNHGIYCVNLNFNYQETSLVLLTFISL